MKILHTADIHLREYGDERWETIEELIKIGKKEKIDLFVISGDLFDAGINAENLRHSLRGIFSGNGFKIVILPGNHDRESYQTGMYFGADVVILTDFNKPFEYKDLRVWGLPFEDKSGEEIVNKFRSIKDKLISDKTNILLYHGELVDSYFSRSDMTNCTFP
ncbi:MAG TPA: hypothetical protein GXX15_04840 [Clostridia bacterium]|nr:hypothetical protein [Clostridia bacterium]